jgi:hypothetical protein
MAAHEGLKGAHVSPSRPFDEPGFLLVQWTALHCVLSRFGTPARVDRFPGRIEPRWAPPLPAAVLAEQLAGAAARLRPGEQVALGEVAAELVQLGELARGLGATK